MRRTARFPGPARIPRLLEPLTAATARSGAAPGCALAASGFLTIGGTTYVDPSGSYPIDQLTDRPTTLIINDTDRHITIVTERDRGGFTDGGQRTEPVEVVLPPGGRAEVTHGHSVQIG
ncbi:hypothetical protein [Streptomyces celluloflavus]|uniref:Uncharacterized protein n=2 Tax=Streptomyces TaxID=1883 RepID=A0ABW7RLF7_9ACTN|nr:hypothetical protein OG717_12170 [Streptomyces celluloflavus]